MQWQYLTPDDETNWKNVEGAQDAEYTFVLNEENNLWSWRLLITVPEPMIPQATEIPMPIEDGGTGVSPTEEVNTESGIVEDVPETAAPEQEILPPFTEPPMPDANETDEINDVEAGSESEEDMSTETVIMDILPESTPPSEELPEA